MLTATELTEAGCGGKNIETSFSEKKRILLFSLQDQVAETLTQTYAGLNL